MATSRATLAPAIARTALLASYPNPASDGVTIRFSLAAAGTAELEIYSLAGRLVRRVVAERFNAGEHSSRWDGLDAGGRRVGAGIYFVRLRAAGTTFTQKFFVAG
jgi:flagellar hook assembly protein FlgD